MGLEVRWTAILSCISLFGVSLVSPSLRAQDYPRVVSPTGRFYGPTQAHWQYERQHGHPWPGGPAPYDPNYGMMMGPIPYGPGPFVPAYGIHFVTPGLMIHGYQYQWQGNGVPGWGYPGSDYYREWSVAHPGIISPWPNRSGYAISPGLAPGVQPGLVPHPAMNQQAWNGSVPGSVRPDLPNPVPRQQQAIPPGLQPAFEPIPEVPLVELPHPIQLLPRKSTPEARRRSLHALLQGDQLLQKQNYLQAYSRYKQASNEAPDLATPRLRMAYALTLLNRFPQAVAEIQRAISLEEAIVRKHEGPQQVLGDTGLLAWSGALQKVATWVREEPHTPERLYLMGALLHMDDDFSRSQELWQLLARSAPDFPTLTAFLQAKPAVRPEADALDTPLELPIWLKDGDIQLPLPTVKNTGPVNAPQVESSFQSVPKRNSTENSPAAKFEQHAPASLEPNTKSHTETEKSNHESGPDIPPG